MAMEETYVVSCNGMFCASSRWMFPKIGVPKMDGENNGNPIKIDDLGVPLFLETPI